MKLKLLICILSFVYINTNAQNTTVVKGLKLKFALIDVSYEIYETNVQNEDLYTKEKYEKNMYSEHYQWLTDTYNKFSKAQKEDLRTIITSVGPWSVMQNTAQLNDTAGFLTVLNQAESSSDNNAYKLACSRFYPEFYNTYFKEYFLKYEQIIDKKVSKINEEIKKDSFDIFQFMEKNSGLKFEKISSPVFYYTIRPIGAMAFETKNEKISLISSIYSNYKILYFAPFHEYSHFLFNLFSSKSEFVKISEDVMKSDSLMKLNWENGAKESYGTNSAWCEENLIDGFSKFLFYKLTGKVPRNRNYVYDIEFCDYLISINFTPNEMKLEDACINFYKKMLKK